MLHRVVYPKVESLINRIAAWLHAKGLTPNQLTLAGCVLSFVTGCIYAGGHFFLGGIALIVASAPDLLDGALARVSGKTTKFGGFLDSTLDRYSDFFLFGGIALGFARAQEAGWMLLTLGILLGSFVTSYAKARAENLIPDCRVGFFERAERIVILLVGSLIGPLLGPALWILAIGTHWTAVQRILHTRRALSR